MLTQNKFEQLVEDARAGGSTHVVIPVHKRLGADLLTPVSAFLRLRKEARSPFLFESVEGGEKLARYSFLGRDPHLTVRASGASTVIECPGKPDETKSQSVFEVLAELMDRYTEVAIPDLPRLTGGAVGFFSYDCVRLIENLDAPPPADLDVPDAIWCFYDSIAAFDHVKHQLVLMASAFVRPGEDLKEVYASAIRKLETMEKLFSGSHTPTTKAVELQGNIRSNVKQADFERSVLRAKEYIREGDIFQVVLSQRFTSSFTGDPFNLYRALRQINPSPYLFYLDFDGFKLVGSSPEVLVRVEEGRAELLPIAGTRPRGETHEDDEALANDLMDDPKERAEHLMLVDLGRNDLSRISQYGTVSVDRYAYVERYSHVMHIASIVESEMLDDKTALDVLQATLPVGTLSGAPKVRAMEIIDELEPEKRGIYGGAMGYLAWNGNMDMAIAIRTSVIKNDKLYVQAGAGIVADSVPELEWEETLNKARAIVRAVQMADNTLTVD